MAKKTKVKCIGVLTSGGDCPGLNATIRGVSKAAIRVHQMEVMGIMDGFTGLIENRMIRLDDRELTGLLTMGGTILGTSRNKPHKFPDGKGGTKDMTAVAIENAHRAGIDCLVCIGGGGTIKNAMHLAQNGVNVICLPKTIDNDVACTDVTFGFDTGMSIATEAIDRLHTTASSHHRIMVVGIMGHNSGWLALGSCLAGGGDVVLIPEIPYRVDKVVQALQARQQNGRRFSIVVVSEGAISVDEAEKRGRAVKDAQKKKKKAPRWAVPDVGVICNELAAQLEKATGIEARATSLGHLQRGGIPTPTDRLLATQLGTYAVDLIAAGKFSVMVAVRSTGFEPVSLEKVAGNKKVVPMESPMIDAARKLGVCLGD